MKAIVVDKIGDFVIKDLPIPKLSKGEALVKVSITGLCRTDLKIIRDGHRDLTLPRIPGEEVVGVVVDSMDGDHSLIGRRVYIYPGTSCHQCDMCSIGAENLCRSMQIMGFHRDGGFATYVKSPVENLIVIPDDLTDEDALFIEPLSCCLNAIEIARVTANDFVGIWGAGPAGNLLNRASLSIGAKTEVIEPDLSRRTLVFGREKPPQDMVYDVAFVAVGNEQAYREAIGSLRPRGRMIVFSGLSNSTAIQPIDLNRLHYYEQTIVGAYGCSIRHSVTALEFIRNGNIQVNDLISHRMSLWELSDALQMVASRTCMKIHLHPDI